MTEEERYLDNFLDGVDGVGEEGTNFLVVVEVVRVTYTHKHDVRR